MTSSSRTGGKTPVRRGAAARTPAHADHFVGPAELQKALGGAVAVASELAQADPPGTVVIIGPDHRNAGPGVGTSYASW